MNHEINRPVKAGHLLDSLYWSIRNGEDIDNIPGLLEKLIEKDTWREVYVEKYDEVRHYERFEEFLTTPAPFGVGTSVETVKRLIGDNAQALNMLDVAIQGRAGKTWDSRTTDNTVDNVHSNSDRPDGNTRQAGIRRLRKSRPDLLERVTSGELSTHKAMIEAGFRKRTVSICPDDPATKIATKLRKELTLEKIAEIVKELN